MKKNLPFGLLFEETVQDDIREIPKILYSSTQQISYSLLESGEIEPYVITSLTMGTGTATKVRAEDTSDDDRVHDMYGVSFGTQTVTRVSSEPTDSDENRLSLCDSSIPLLGTETHTMDKAETTDSDRTLES